METRLDLSQSIGITSIVGIYSKCSYTSLFTFQFSFECTLISPVLKQCVVLSFVDVEEAAADGGEVGTQRWELIPAVTHQLQQLRVVGRVVFRNRRTKRRLLATTHTHEYICPRSIKTKPLCVPDYGTATGASAYVSRKYTTQSLMLSAHVEQK